MDGRDGVSLREDHEKLASPPSPGTGTRMLIEHWHEHGQYVGTDIFIGNMTQFFLLFG